MADVILGLIVGFIVGGVVCLGIAYMLMGNMFKGWNG